MADMPPTPPETMPVQTPRVQTLPPRVAYALAPLLVYLVTWALLLLQQRLQHNAPALPVRPFGIAFLPFIGLLTVLGGRGPGLLSLALSGASLWFALMAPAFTVSARHSRDWIKLIT